MHALLAGVSALALLTLDVALAANKLAPAEIQSTFFDGKPFTAATTSGTKFKLTFTAQLPLIDQVLNAMGVMKNTRGKYLTTGTEKTAMNSVVYTVAEVEN